MVRYLVFAALIPLLAGNGIAAEKQVPLTEAVALALQNNHEIRASAHALAAQQEEIGIARSFLLPKVVFEERFLRTDNPTYSFMAKLNQERFAQEDFAVDTLNNPKAINDFQTALSFEQLLFARKSAIGLAMAKIEYAAEQEDYVRKREEIAFNVVQRYLMVRTAREYAAVAERTVEDTKEHVRVADVRYQAGLGLYSDTLRAATALTDAEQRLVSAQKNLDVARRALGLLLGTAESVETVDETFELPLMERSYYENASLLRKDIASLRMRHDNAKNEIKRAQAGYLPVVGIGGSYQFNDHRRPFGAEGESWQIGAFLRWDLFDGARREHERAKAHAKAAETEEHLKGLRNRVSFQVYESYLGVAEARKNAELSRAALKTAEEGKRLVQKRYENSLSPLVDLLDAQISLDHARANLVARENEYRIAAARLSYESGTILRDLKIEQ